MPCQPDQDLRHRLSIWHPWTYGTDQLHTGQFNPTRTLGTVWIDGTYEPIRLIRYMTYQVKPTGSLSTARVDDTNEIYQIYDTNHGRLYPSGPCTPPKEVTPIRPITLWHVIPVKISHPWVVQTPDTFQTFHAYQVWKVWEVSAPYSKVTYSVDRLPHRFLQNYTS